MRTENEIAVDDGADGVLYVNGPKVASIKSYRCYVDGGSIKEVNQRAEIMRMEQQEEERKLGEKEKQFFVVDRLGLIMLLQKYLH